jgi:hypothetical protein
MTAGFITPTTLPLNEKHDHRLNIHSHVIQSQNSNGYLMTPHDQSSGTCVGMHPKSMGVESTWQLPLSATDNSSKVGHHHKTMRTRRVRFERHRSNLEKVMHMVPDPSRMQRSYSSSEYQQIDRESKISIAQGAKGGLALWLDHSLVDRECPVVQSRLNYWTMNAGCTRGLEMLANHREGFMRQTNRRRHTLLILQVQKLVKKRAHVHVAQEHLGRFSATSSQRAVVLARMMGTADEVAAASMDQSTDVDMTDASIPSLRLEALPA